MAKPIELKEKVRSQYATGNFTKKQIAKIFNLNYNTVVGILRKK